MKEREMFLRLEDGSVWGGTGMVHSPRGAVGEVVFDTAATGYPQALTDPSFEGQIVVFAFPMIGTYRVDEKRLESGSPRIRGVVAGFMEDGASAGAALKDWLYGHGVAWVHGVDTRRLVRYLRERGPVRGIITGDRQGTIGAPDWDHPARRVSVEKVMEYAGCGSRIAVLDYGVKEGIIRELTGRGCHVVRFPHDSEPEEIFAARPEGVLLGNGPGDPALLDREISTVKTLSEKLPIAGICLGMQLLALALGARTEKLRYGHRGANHAVLHIPSGRGWLTSQNHRYAVVGESLALPGFDLTHRNLGDGSVEGIRHRDLPLSGVQYHPEGSPGPRDGNAFFDEFLETVRSVS